MLNWSNGSRGEDFYNCQCIFTISLLSPLEKGGALHLNKLEYSLPKEGLCQDMSKLAKWFWRRRFLNFVNIFSLFRYHLQLEKGGVLHLNKRESLAAIT